MADIASNDDSSNEEILDAAVVLLLLGQEAPLSTSEGSSSADVSFSRTSSTEDSETSSQSSESETSSSSESETSSSDEAERSSDDGEVMNPTDDLLEAAQGLLALAQAEPVPNSAIINLL